MAASEGCEVLYRKIADVMRAVRPVIEGMEGRQLYSVATPNISVASDPLDPAHSVVVTYSVSDGSHLELVMKAPGDDNFRVVNTSLDSSLGNHTATLGSLTPNRGYEFKVRADSGGEVAYAKGSISTKEAASSTATYELPAPTSLQGDLDQQSYDDWGDIIWTSSYDGDYSEYGTIHTEETFGNLEVNARAWRTDDPYHVLVGLRDTPLGNERNASSSATHHNIDILAGMEGTTTQVTLQIVDTSTGEMSPESEPMTVTAPGTLAQPLELSAEENGSQTRISWSGMDTSVFDPDWETPSLRLYAVNGDSASYIGSYLDSQEYVDVTPADSQTKYFAVYANSAYSNTVDAEGNSTPLAPSNLTAELLVTGDTGKAALVWDDNSNNDDGFKIEQSDDDGSTWTSVGSVGADVTHFEITLDRDDMTNYAYRVKAKKKGGGFSGASNTAARPWPINGVVTNDTQTAVRVHNDQQGWHDVAAGATTPNFSRDEDFVYIDGKYYKIGASHVYIRYTAGPAQGTRSVYEKYDDPVLGHGLYKELTPIGAGGYIPPGTP